MHVAGCWLQREQTQLLLVDCQVGELPAVNRINISLSVPPLEQLWSFRAFISWKDQVFHFIKD